MFITEGWTLKAQNQQFDRSSRELVTTFFEAVGFLSAERSQGKQRVSERKNVQEIATINFSVLVPA